MALSARPTTPHAGPEDGQDTPDPMSGPTGTGPRIRRPCRHLVAPISVARADAGKFVVAM
jgi:hypothetical protein